jgi:putative zinc finger protein
MKGNGQIHPARSVDFLSRLHDGELDAGERARFESHRAHCAECRRSVVEFEDAIALFRSTRSGPPRSDLAGRILRKVQSTNRPRTPFPRRFQIDLGWAALMLTALFAVLIMTPILARKNPATAPAALPTPGEKPSIIVQLPSGPAEASRPPETKDRAGGRLADARPAAPRRSRAEDRSAGPVAAAPEAEVGATRQLEPSEPAEAKGSAARVGAAAAEAPAGGSESDASTRMQSAAASLRVSVREGDGFGSPPALRTMPRVALPPSERGREYVVLVDPQGTVTGVIADREVSGALSRIRFEAGPRPRRLLVRIE